MDAYRPLDVRRRNRSYTLVEPVRRLCRLCGLVWTMAPDGVCPPNIRSQYEIDVMTSPPWAAFEEESRRLRAEARRTA